MLKNKKNWKVVSKYVKKQIEIKLKVFRKFPPAKDIPLGNPRMSRKATMYIDS